MAESFLPLQGKLIVRDRLLRAGVGLLLVLAALAVGRAVFLRVRAQAEPMPVIVARTGIAAYSQIDERDVEVMFWPAAVVPGDAHRMPAAVVGRYAVRSIPAGAPLRLADTADAAHLRYDALTAAVIVAVRVGPGRAPITLLAPEQRVDVWRGTRLLAGALRLVAFTSDGEGTWLAALECGQDQVPDLLAASGQPDTALTLAPLVRAPSPTPTAVARCPTPTPCAAPTATVAPTPTAAPPTRTPVAVVKPGPAAGLRVRSGPGLDYPVLATLTGGAQLTVMGRDATGGWVQICCVKEGGAERPGWVRADLVELDFDVQDLPVAPISIHE